MGHISELNDACRSTEYWGAHLFKHALLISTIRYINRFWDIAVKVVSLCSDIYRHHMSQISLRTCMIFDKSALFEHVIYSWTHPTPHSGCPHDPLGCPKTIVKRTSAIVWPLQYRVRSQNFSRTVRHGYFAYWNPIAVLPVTSWDVIVFIVTQVVSVMNDGRTSAYVQINTETIPCLLPVYYIEKQVSKTTCIE